MRTYIRVFVVLAMLGGVVSLPAADPPPSTLHLTVSNRVKTVTWPRPLIPALESNRLLSAQSVTNFAEVASTNIALAPWGYTYVTSNDWPAQFFDLQLQPMTSNALLSANVLNRLAYGPSPDDLEHVAAIGPQAYIDEQLAPENLANPLDAYTVDYTNAVSLPPATNWTTVTVTGLVSSSTLYMYLTEVGEVSVDDVRLAYSYVLTAVTNTVTVVTNGTDLATNSLITTNVFTNLTANLVVNGDFEQPLGAPWTVSPNLAGSYLDTSTFASGGHSLRMVASAPGTTQASAIWQTLPAAPTTTRGTNVIDAQTKVIFTNTISSLRAILTFSCLPNASSRSLILRLSGSGLIISGTEPPATPAWIYVTATGPATTTPNLYLYLSGAGEGYIDDLKLVSGTVPEAGSNLVVNGDFEQPLTNGWQTTADFTNSYVDNTVSHSGAGSLHIVATAAGSGSGDALFQAVPRVTNGLTYTLSYWYRPATSGRTLTARLSGGLLTSTPDTIASGLKRRLDAANWGVLLSELRTWYCLNAVSDPRQLIEILTQFFENHFVTYHSKTMDYFDAFYDGTTLDRIATDLEYREVSRWRRALANPNCTFYDLLRISAESPAQIIYLDTVGSRGDGTRIANENYGRELLELFTMGVDNGYDQLDITVMSRAWTGWTVGIVDRRNIDNPFAPAGGPNSPNPSDANVLRYGNYPGAGYSAVSNIIGVWTFIYNQNWHGTNRAPILSVWDTNSPATNPRAIGPKVIPARFGPPWAGRPYQLVLPARTGTNGMQDGDDVIKHLSELPFTAEYISVKLCRVFVHDDFPNPTTRPELPEYAFYDYTNPSRSPEAELIRQCIVAWDTPGPDGRKGSLRLVLRTIFSSDLFRSQGGSRQKVKTPLEFVISAARALRSVDATGAGTTFTDGGFSDAMIRMGNMSLFNRADPDGYPETGPPWISAGTLAERLRFVQTLCMDPGQTGGRPSDAGNNTVEPVDLLQRKLPPNLWTDAGAVADLFLSYLFPGEGRANLDLYRASAINFLNDGTADPTGNNTSAKPFNQLTVSSSATSSYDLRVRGMVAMLMTLQRFQEQ